MRREITLLGNCLEEAAWLVEPRVSPPCRPLIGSSNQSHRTASSVATEHDSELGLRGSLKSGRQQLERTQTDTAPFMIGKGNRRDQNRGVTMVGIYGTLR